MTWVDTFFDSLVSAAKRGLVNANGPMDFYKVFNFEVEFVGKRRIARAGFFSVSGIKASMQIQQVQEGGVNDQPHDIPKGMTYQPIIMERGMTSEVDAITLFSGQFNSDGTGVSIAPDDLAVVRIKHKDRAGNVVRAYELREVLIIGYETADLVATQSAIAIERLTIQFKEVDIS